MDAHHVFIETMEQPMNAEPMNEELVDTEIPLGDAAESVEPTATGRATLTVKRGGSESDDVFTFTTPAVIGRFDPSVGPVDIDLGPLPEGQYVSRKHARITEADGIWSLEDLGSSNGTYVLRDDFERIESAEIADGDEIALGNARLVFRLITEDASAE